MGTVFIDPQSGNAQSVPTEHVPEAIKGGMYVPLVDPDGNPTSIPYAEAGNYLQNGFKQPTAEQLQNLLDATHYSTPIEKAKAEARGIIKGIAGPLGALTETKVFGTDPADILKNEQINSGHTLSGELIGTGAALLAPGLKAASLPGVIAKIGNATAKVVGGAGVWNAVGRATLKGVAEAALYEASHQAHESILGNPEATGENFVASTIGAGLLGGGISAVLSPLAIGAGKLTGLAKEGTLDALTSQITPSEEQVNWAKLIKEGALRAGTGAAIGYTLGGGPVGSAVAGIAGLSTGDLAHQAQKLAGKLIRQGLGNEQAVKVITTLFDSSMKTMGAIERSAGSLLGAASERAIETSDHKYNDKMIEKIKDLAATPSALIEHIQDAIGPISQHAPETGMAIASTLTNAVNFLKSKIPNTDKIGMLNPDRVPSQSEKAQFGQYMRTIEDPMSVFRDIKTGLISPNHLEALNTVYPTMANQMKATTLTKITEYLAKHPAAQIPYKTRLGLSMFLGQNLDSTMSPQALMSNQAALQSSAADKAQQEQQGLKPSKAGMGKMKSAQRDRTTYEQSANRRSA